VSSLVKTHTVLVIGGRDMEAGVVSVRLHHSGPQGSKPKAEVVADILASIKERRALVAHLNYRCSIEIRVPLRAGSQRISNVP
jgi:hypothetical protein